jgi:hypothetical protein
MKSFGRRFRTATCLLSLLLAIVVLAWLVRSVSDDDRFHFVHTYISGNGTVRLELEADVNRGRLVLMAQKQSTPWSSNEAAQLYLEGVRRYEPPEPPFSWKLLNSDEKGTTTQGMRSLGFQWANSSAIGQRNARGSRSLADKLSGSPPPSPPDSVGHYVLGLPLWFLALILLAPAVFKVAGDCRRVRLRIAGRCANCGYDLRATPGRCPECGAAAQTA